MKKIFIILFLLILSGCASKADLKLETKLGADTLNYQVLDWKKPTTDAEWAEDVKKESLNFKLDYELQQMKTDLENKLIRVQQPLLDKINYPDAIRWEMIQAGIKEPELTKEVEQRITQYKLEYEKMSQSIERISKEIELRKNGKIDRTNDIISTTPSTEQEKIEIQNLKKLKGIQ